MAYSIGIVCVVYQNRGKKIANLFRARDRMAHTNTQLFNRSALSLTDRSALIDNGMYSALVVQTLAIARQMPCA